MEIIKKGKLPEEEVFEHTCSNCGTIFSFKRKEAKFNSDQRDGDFLSINCPLCQKVRTISLT